MIDNRRDTPYVTCSFCETTVRFKNYADHLAKKHPGGANAFRPVPKSRATLGDLLADSKTPLILCQEE